MAAATLRTLLIQCNDSFDLVSEKHDIDSFIAEHASDPSYQRTLEDLKPRYCAVRKTRADGSCFYRGLAFSYLESLLGNRQEIRRFKKQLMESRDELLEAGFQEEEFSHCYNAFLSLVGLADRDDGSDFTLLAAFNHPEVSDNAVRCLRLIASAALRNRADFYQPFVEDGLCVAEFCAQHVEPMTAVCDHIHISALTQALPIPLLVEHADSVVGTITRHTFPEGKEPSVYMLYKQDHYTVLYRVVEP